jgi:hypothetical protein
MAYPAKSAHFLQLGAELGAAFIMVPLWYQTLALLNNCGSSWAESVSGTTRRVKDSFRFRASRFVRNRLCFDTQAKLGTPLASKNPHPSAAKRGSGREDETGTAFGTRASLVSPWANLFRPPSRVWQIFLEVGRPPKTSKLSLELFLRPQASKGTPPDSSKPLRNSAPSVVRFLFLANS